jgi:molybdenum cofactor cytidylyltransferase
MGGDSKALLRFDERDTFVTRIVRTFVEAGLTDVVVIVGHAAERVTAALEQSGMPCRVVINAAYRDGQFSSVLAALDAVDRPGVDAMLLTLVDAPLFTTSTVRAVMERFEQSRAPVVRPVRGTEHGHPVLIRADLFDAIRRSDPSRGAKPVVRAHASEAGDVPVDDPGAFVDIDTPDEYAQLMQRAPRRVDQQ